MIDTQKYFDEGFAAYSAGSPKIDCPYQYDSTEGGYWFDGFNANRLNPFQVPGVVFIPVSDVSTQKMVAGNEKKYPTVIYHEGVRDWIGFGWIALRIATKSDYESFPVVATKG